MGNNNMATMTPAMQADEKLALAIYNTNKKIGDLTELPTSVKTSIIAAIKELHDNIAAATSGGLTRSEAVSIAQAEISKLLGGASSSYDTLKEIEDLLKQNDTAAAAVLSEIGALKTKDTELNNRINQIETNLTPPSNWLTVIDNILATGKP